MKTGFLFLLILSCCLPASVYSQTENIIFPTEKHNIIPTDSPDVFPEVFFESSLPGRVAGVTAVPVSGQPGSAWDIRIRRSTSVNYSVAPLYVIDGIPVYSGRVDYIDGFSTNMLATLNPEDIESISILKDATAYVLYGSRAVNGVVEIRTRRGGGKKINVRFGTQIGFSAGAACKNHPKASMEDQLMLKYEGFYNERIYSGYKPEYAQEYAKERLGDFFPEDPRGLFDWKDALYRRALLQNYNLDLSGKIKNTRYYLSAAYAHQQGRTIANGSEHWTGRFNLSQKFLKIFEWDSRIFYGGAEKSGFKDNNPDSENIFFAQKNLLQDCWWPEDSEGVPVTRFGFLLWNPLYYVKYQEDSFSVNNLYVNESVSAEPVRGLKFFALAGYEQVGIKEEWWRSREHYSAAEEEGLLSQWKNRYRRLTVRSTVNWEKVFSQRHFLNLTGGFEFERRGTRYKEIHARGFSGAQDREPSKAQSISPWKEKVSSSVYRTWFGGGAYQYAGKYFIRGMYRSTSTNKDVAGYAPFGSADSWIAGVAWKISGEEFMKNADWLSNLELRGSYGKQTLHKIPFYVSNNSFHDTEIDIRPYYRNFELGMEIEFDKGNWNFSANYFSRYQGSKGQEYLAETSKDPIYHNIADVLGKGVEFSFSGRILQTKSCNWVFSVNAACSENVIKNIDNKWIMTRKEGADINFLISEGQSAYSFYGLEYAGVNPDDGSPLWYVNDSSGEPQGKYKTLGGREVTSQWNKAGRVVIGCAEPKLYGGISTDFSWKGLSLSVLFSYSLGGDAYDAMGHYMNDDGYWTQRSLGKEALGRWQKPGDITSVPKRMETNYYSGTQSRWIYKNNYLKMKNLTLAYNFPVRLLRKIKAASLRVYFTGENLFTIAGRQLFDPEVGVWGVSGMRLPQGRNLFFGMEIGW